MATFIPPGNTNSRGSRIPTETSTTFSALSVELFQDGLRRDGAIALVDQGVEDVGRNLLRRIQRHPAFCAHSVVRRLAAGKLQREISRLRKLDREADRILFLAHENE